MNPWEYRALRPPETGDRELSDWLNVQAAAGWEPFASGPDGAVFLRRPALTQEQRREHERRNAEACAILRDGLAQRRREMGAGPTRPPG